MSKNLTSLKNMVKTMYEVGFTYQEIGNITDVSRQRAHQFAVQSAINQQIAAKHAKKLIDYINAHPADPRCRAVIATVKGVVA